MPLEEVLGVCTHVRIEDQAGPRVMPLDAALPERVQQVTRRLGQDGLRGVAVAVKDLPPTQTTYAVADETGLTLVGYIAFLDPPKESAAPALRALAGHGIQVKVLTGDNELVARSVCKQVGLSADEVLLGSQVEDQSEEALAQAVEQCQVSAKLTPLHQERIVRALRAGGHVVGFMGDGINDAPALRAADIGIPVDSAVDIAKEATDIILLERSLLVLDEGVVTGPASFSNMLKYARMTASSNFGNVLSVLVASAFLPFLPMLPLHLRVQNLLYDISQTGIRFDDVRTPRLPFVESRAAAPLTLTTGAIVIVGLWLPTGPLAGHFRLQALPPAFFPWLLGSLLGYGVLTTVMKRWYVRRFGWL